MSEYKENCKICGKRADLDAGICEECKKKQEEEKKDED